MTVQKTSTPAVMTSLSVTVTSNEDSRELLTATAVALVAAVKTGCVDPMTVWNSVCVMSATAQ